MKVIIFGDSIAQGFSDNENNGWASHLAIHLQKKTIDLNYEEIYSVFNLSISGETSSDMLRRFESELETRLSSSSKNVVIIAVGMNDAAHRGEEHNNEVLISDFKLHIQHMISVAKANTDNVCILGLTTVDESLLNPYLASSTEKSWIQTNVDNYDESISKLAEKNKITFIPMLDLLTTAHLQDGLHPNPAGHRLMYERVKSVLKSENIL